MKRFLAFSVIVAFVLCLAPQEAVAKEKKKARLKASVQALVPKLVASGSEPASGMTRYLIQYHPGNGQQLEDLIASLGGKVVFDYALIDGLAADLTRAGRNTVRRSGLARTIEEDALLELHAHLPNFAVEFVGYGVDRVQADVVWSTAPNTGAAANGAAAPSVQAGAITGQGVFVGVLDTGVDLTHPDLAANVLVPADGAIRDFIDGDADPSDTVIGHGTAVSSVIASVDNSAGVIGVAPEATIIPYRVCAAFCPLSAIIGGLVQAIIDGVDVVNMSFGGPAGFNIEASAVQAANAAGIVLVASAGNGATQKPSFPAAYDTVLAVGATDINDNAASFTNVGGWVDVTGPGVAVPAATCQGCGRDSFLDEISPTAQSFSNNTMFGSAVASVLGTEIVDVGRACNVDLPLPVSPAGKVALIKRGLCSFAEKVMNAETAGAVGTVIYNSVSGNFFGTLGAFSAAGPSVSVSNADGLTLVAEIGSGTTKVDLKVVATDYALVNGTSFSGPHVAGVAALVKDADGSLSPIEVRKIIEMTAEPIGPKVIFGNGMVRADLAVAAAQ